MSIRFVRRALGTGLGLGLWAAACAPARAPAPGPVPEARGRAGFPPVPFVDGPLQLAIRYPLPGTPRPAVDSTFLFGSTGSGRARLWINGVEVPVAPNGAFLAFLPLPVDGVWRLEARRGRERATADVAYAPPPASPPRPVMPPVDSVFPEPRWVEVIATGDTLQGGFEGVPLYPTPTDAPDRVGQLPRGARLPVVGRRGRWYRLLWGDEVRWIPVEATLETVPPPRGPARWEAEPAPFGARLRLRGAGYAPFDVRPDGACLEVEVARPGLAVVAAATRSLPVRAAQPLMGDTLHTVWAFDLDFPVWGWRAFYDPGGDLVVDVRRPPAFDPAHPLHGLRIVLDPGHPPAGTIGPTGLTEADANLAVALATAQRLRAAGAEVLLTRTGPEPRASASDPSVELRARVAFALAAGADLYVSIHHNAFPDGTNPFVHEATEVYYYHSMGRPLATRLLDRLVQVTLLPPRGPLRRSLAVARLSWMPSVLTEAAYLMFPDVEAALRNPAFVDRLADAHARALEEAVREGWARP